MNIHALMCEALIGLPTSEETSGEVTILLVTSPAVSKRPHEKFNVIF